MRGREVRRQTTQNMRSEVDAANLADRGQCLTEDVLTLFIRHKRYQIDHREDEGRRVKVGLGLSQRFGEHLLTPFAQRMHREG